MNDIKHGCSVCHELLTPEGTAEHHCGRTPEGTLPANRPHRAELFLTDAELDDFLATIRGEDHT